MSKTTNETVTDEQIEALRAEAASAGDELQIAICDVALADRLDDEIPESVDVVGHMTLERAGVHVTTILASDEARAVCARVIAENEAQS